jgi:hypothetical protein
LKANKVNLFVSSVLFVFWYHSLNFLDTPRIACLFYCVPEIAALSHSLHPLGNPVIAPALRDTIKETLHIKRVVTTWISNLQLHLYIALDMLTIFIHEGNKPAHNNVRGPLQYKGWMPMG